MFKQLNLTEQQKKVAIPFIVLILFVILLLIFISTRPIEEDYDVPLDPKDSGLYDGVDSQLIIETQGEALNGFNNNANSAINIVLTGQSEESSLSKIDVYKRDELLKTIGENNIIDASVISENYIIYQQIGSNLGIYTYNIKDDSSSILFETSDPNSFKNILYIGNDEILYIQPNTGKVGVINLVTLDNYTIDEEVLSTSPNSNSVSAFRYPFKSEKNEYFGFYKMTQNDDVTVLVYNKELGYKESPYITQEIDIPYGGFDDENTVASFSHDLKYVAFGNTNKLINLNTKELVELNIEKSIIKFSPNSYRYISLSNGSISVHEIAKELNQELPENISEIEWVDSDNLVLIINQNLYLYNISSTNLYKLIDEKANYSIYSVSTNGTIYIKQNSNLLKLTINLSNGQN